jgi:hypothetical protein
MDFQNDLCVVGEAGHVGLPFALVFPEAGLRWKVGGVPARWFE